MLSMDIFKTILIGSTIVAWITTMPRPPKQFWVVFTIYFVLGWLGLSFYSAGNQWISDDLIDTTYAATATPQGNDKGTP